jgi:hypothetical protein
VVQEFDSHMAQMSRMLVLKELDDLLTYVGHLDAYIRESEAQAVKQIIMRSGWSEAELSPEFWADNYPVHWKEIFGARLMSSIPVLSFTIVEVHLRVVCIRASSLFDIQPPWKEKPGNITGQAKLFLRKRARILQPDEEAWELLLSHYIVRNCIVHNAGWVILTREKEKLQKFVDATNGLQIDKNSLLRVRMDYCTQLIQFLSTFFHSLHDGFRERASPETPNNKQV